MTGDPDVPDVPDVTDVPEAVGVRGVTDVPGAVGVRGVTDVAEAVGAASAPSAAREPGPEEPCPCGVGRSYDRCCGRLHRGEAEAVTAEQLMRSRYSAFAVGDEAYLLRSWHPATAPPTVRFDPELEWVGLRVLGSTGGGFADDEGTVEFRATYRRRGQPGELHEHSEFVRLDGRWVYAGPIDAELA